jgi:two-component system, cell cycle response regulator
MSSLVGDRSGLTLIPRLARALRVLSFVALALFAAHTLVRFGGPGVARAFNDGLYNALILLAALITFLRVISVRSERGAWLVLSIGISAWAAGELLFSFLYANSPPTPSLADAFYLAFYPACYIALLLLVRSRVSSFNRSLWLDGVMAGSAAAALSATVVFQVVLAHSQGSPAAVLTNLAYPLGDMLLLALVIGVFTLSGWRPGPGWALLGAGLVASAVADGVYLDQTATNSYVVGTIVDAFWPAAMLLLASAAWQTGGRVAQVDLEGRPLLATPALCGLTALGLLVFDNTQPLNPLALSLAVATLLAVLLRTGLTFGENSRMLARIRTQASTDALTGLGNRRRLLADLEQALAQRTALESRLLIIFDLNGFKYYNDSFGHPAGDALLRRLGGKLVEAAGPYGRSYRLGGDEFCVLAAIPESGAETFLDAGAAALCELGEGFTITSSFGAVFLPDEAVSASEALRLADQRLYAQKRSAWLAREHPHALVLQVLFERVPELREHGRSVAALSLALGRELALEADQLEELALAAELHDVGKLAIPDAILDKPGPLEEVEWAIVRRHPAVGERILSASPALQGIGAIVRSTHERWDGTGYPDGLEGSEIPLAARIIAVCDAFASTTSARLYRNAISPSEALAELRRCASSQFDPEIVRTFCEQLELQTSDKQTSKRTSPPPRPAQPEHARLSPSSREAVD